MCFGYEKRLAKQALRATGRVKGISPVGGGGQPVPLVEFTDEAGNLVCHAVQRHGMRGVKAGQEVDVLYTHKKVLGMDAWNIFIVKNGCSPFRAYRFAGSMMLALGSAFAAVGIWII